MDLRRDNLFLLELDGGRGGGGGGGGDEEVEPFVKTVSSDRPGGRADLEERDEVRTSPFLTGDFGLVLRRG